MDAKAVGQRIKAAREKKNMTQEDLAALIDISPTHISVIERGTKIARMDTFVAIANVLEVSADALLVDVVEHSALGVASELSAAIADRSVHLRYLPRLHGTRAVCDSYGKSGEGNSHGIGRRTHIGYGNGDRRVNPPTI